MATVAKQACPKEYSLTPLGRTLLEPVQGLASWAFKSGEQMRSARRRFELQRGDDEH
jgi:DNA-binding HxlR family transcriptional regulator